MLMKPSLLRDGFDLEGGYIPDHKVAYAKKKPGK